MASTTINPATGFYAVVNFSPPSPTITKIGYRPGIKIWMPNFFAALPDQYGRAVIQPLPTDIWTGGDPSATQIRTPFESFLRVLYGVQCEMTGRNNLPDLYNDMDAAGVLSQCAAVQVVDFMAFCGAIERYQVLPGGSQVDCLRFGAGDNRPLVADLRRKDDSLMWQIIEFLGLWGMLPHLFIKGGISFETFIEKLKVWQPEPEARQAYYVSTLRNVLRQGNAPVLSPDQIEMIFS